MIYLQNTIKLKKYECFFVIGVSTIELWMFVCKKIFYGLKIELQFFFFWCLVLPKDGYRFIFENYCNTFLVFKYLHANRMWDNFGELKLWDWRHYSKYLIWHFQEKWISSSKNDLIIFFINTSLFISQIGFLDLIVVMESSVIFGRERR